MKLQYHCFPEGEVPYGNTREDNSVTGTLSDKINDAVDKMSEMGILIH